MACAGGLSSPPASCFYFVGRTVRLLGKKERRLVFLNSLQLSVTPQINQGFLPVLVQLTHDVGNRDIYS